MARIRSVHPDICDDDEMSQVSDRAERTFVRLWTHLDDDGRWEDRPRLIAARLYPVRDATSENTIEEDLTELADEGLIIRYEVGGKRYITAKPETWKRYQKPRHPQKSKYPEPPADAIRRNGSAKRSNETAERRQAPAGEERSRRGVGDGEGGDTAVRRRRPRKPIPKDWNPPPSLLVWAKENYPRVNVKSETEKFRNHALANDRRLALWDAAWRNWIIKADEYLGPNTKPHYLLQHKHEKPNPDGQTRVRQIINEHGLKKP